MDPLRWALSLVCAAALGATACSTLESIDQGPVDQSPSDALADDAASPEASGVDSADVCAACPGACCDGVCEDLDSDPAHCGECFSACGAGGVCQDGRCDRVVAVSAGREHTCAVRAGGAVICWGTSSKGAIGAASSPALEPVLVSGVSDAYDVAVGDQHTCALTTGGVYCWGDNSLRQLGAQVGSTPTPTKVASLGLTNARGITAGAAFTCVLAGNERLFCWGDNSAGQLGQGDTADYLTAVEPLQSVRFKDVAAGGTHVCAVVDAGDVYCWGSATAVDGATDQRRAPARVDLLVPGTRVAAGFDHSCAADTDGVVVCWGDNRFGQLGHDRAEGVPGPVGALSAVDVGPVSAGGGHTCAATTPSGEVWCWGDNSAGQTGSATAPSSLPAPVAGLTASVEAVTTGGSHTCAIDAAGVACWGDGQAGQLGNRSVAASAVPVRPSGL